MVCVAAAMPTVATVTVVTFSGWGLKICKQAAITECLWPLGKGKVCHTHEECMWGAHLPSVGLEPVGGQTTEVSDAWPVRHQTYGYLPSRRVSPPVDRYQIILPRDRGTRV